MIQRIQTLWLFLASLTLLLLFVFPYAHYSDSMGITYNLKITGLYKMVASDSIVVSSFILQTITTVILGLFPLYILISYKVRKKQIQFIYIMLALTLLFGTWLYFLTKSAIGSVNQQIGIGNLDLGTLVIPVTLIFLFLALKGVFNDEKLIKSADRLR